MKRRAFLGSAVGAAVAPTLALAHGPTRQKVTVEAEVAANPEEVWAVVGDFQDMSWHPAVFSTEGENGSQTTRPAG